MTSHTPSLIERLDQPSIADGGQSNEQSVRQLSHTPGPWAVEKLNKRQSPNLWITAPKNSGVCKIEPCDYDDGKGERLTYEDHANARLIAAAPDLVKALTHCQRVLADLVGGDKSLSTINIYAQAVEAESKARAILSATRKDAQR